MTITVIVGDTDPEILYHGPWITVDPSSSFINQSIGQSLHNSSGPSIAGGVQTLSQFTYSFSGTSAGLFAFMTPELVQAAKVPYVWSCSVIGAATDMAPVVLNPLNTPSLLRICFQDGLEDGDYAFEFSTSVAGILIDHLEYAPSASTNSKTYSYIGVSGDDPGIRYTNKTWPVDTTVDGTSGRVQTNGNSTLLYDFTGSAITWIGMTITGSASGSFSIDGQPPTIVPLPAAINFVSEPGQIFFRSADIDPTRQHTIEAISIVTSNQLPTLAIQSLVIADGTIPGSNASTNGPGASLSVDVARSTSSTDVTVSISSPVTMSTPIVSPASSNLSNAAASSRSKSQKLLPIISGTLGAVLFAFFIVFVWAYRKRVTNRTNAARLPRSPLIQPFASDSATMLQDTPRRTFVQPFGSDSTTMLLDVPEHRGVTLSGTKVLRTLSIPAAVIAEETRMIPPSKFRNTHVPSASLTPDTSDTHQPESAPSPSGNTEGSSQPSRSITRIQEEDSGIRMGGSAEEEVILVPPAYTVS